jgi:hypothetical protein
MSLLGCLPFLPFTVGHWGGVIGVSSHCRPSVADHVLEVGFKDVREDFVAGGRSEDWVDEVRFDRGGRMDVFWIEGWLDTKRDFKKMIPRHRDNVRIIPDMRNVVELCNNGMPVIRP